MSVYIIRKSPPDFPGLDQKVLYSFDWTFKTIFQKESNQNVIEARWVWLCSNVWISFEKKTTCNLILKSSIPSTSSKYYK